MAANEDVYGQPDWPTTEAGYWRDTKIARDREDAKIAHEYNTRVEPISKALLKLYEERSNLQKALDNVNAAIAFRNAEEQRLLDDFERRKDMLRMQRIDEDTGQDRWFARVREGRNPYGEAVTPGNNHAQHAPQPALQPASQPPSQTLSQNHPPSASGLNNVNGSLRRSARVREQRSDLFGSVFHNPIEEDTTPSSRALSPFGRVAYPQPTMSPMQPTIERSMRAAEGYTPSSDTRDSVVGSQQGRHGLPRFTRANEELDESHGSRRSSRGRKSLPSVKDAASRTNSPDGEDEDPLPEITRDCLVLQDDGTRMTWPPMYAGVPLEKISPTHPYWNPEWQPLEESIQPTLASWIEKHERLCQDPNAQRHAVFLANRQCNRGQALMKFLEEGCFHPLQFVNREMMDKFYKTFINYDTVFRIANVHEELKKFDLEVTPLEWLRQRLYEISTEQGDKFNLSKTTHDLYSDEKLKQLRKKHGFGNIGRPAGYKVGGKEDEGGDEKEDAKSTAKRKTRKQSLTMSADEQQGETRRRGRRSFGQVDADDELQSPGLLPKDEHTKLSMPRLQKRQRMGAGPGDPEDSSSVHSPDAALADLEYDGYSSRDSFTGGRIMHLDFRVRQIKTRVLTTHPNVTQYWIWKPEDNKFEHQVLRDVQPNITWGHYREPHKLSCALEEMKELRYNSECQKIMIARDDQARGDILVYFKRERTKKRFLTFAKKKGVKLVKTSSTHLEAAWDAMNSETISDREASV
ncbi:hypothetical protein F4861DRAFT_529229 [Xylaria intraflava]|nr:hypothetical protein F4861DRAFT_529229 [Xylaria intraflava]